MTLSATYDTLFDRSEAAMDEAHELIAERRALLNHYRAEACRFAAAAWQQRDLLATVEIRAVASCRTALQAGDDRLARPGRAPSDDWVTFD